MKILLIGGTGTISSATTRFDEGIRRCIDYILAHPELQVDDPEFDQWCDKVIEAQEQAKKNLK